MIREVVEIVLLQQRNTSEMEVEQVKERIVKSLTWTATRALHDVTP